MRTIKSVRQSLQLLEIQRLSHARVESNRHSVLHGVCASMDTTVPPPEADRVKKRELRRRWGFFGIVFGAWCRSNASRMAGNTPASAETEHRHRILGPSAVALIPRTRW